MSLHIIIYITIPGSAAAEDVVVDGMLHNPNCHLPSPLCTGDADMPAGVFALVAHASVVGENARVPSV